MDFSVYYRNKIIDHMLRGQSFTVPTTVYVALFTADTGLSANSPTGEVSLSGTAYERLAVTLSEASAGDSANSAILEWDPATADWGTITHAAIVDHATNTNWGTGVNVLMWDALVAPKSINTDDIFRIPAGNLEIEIR
jgi:hypothetical protein